MNNNQNKTNPFCNRLLKSKLKIKDINMDKFNIEDGGHDSGSCNISDINSILPFCLGKKVNKTPKDETSNRMTKMSNPFTSNANRSIKGQKDLKSHHKNQDKPLKQKEFILHEFRKPERYFSVNHNQFNIESKIEHNRRYQPVSSFELKLSKELQRISQAYKKDDIRKLMYKSETLAAFYQLKPKYEMYRDVKWIENRFMGRTFKAKLLPINYKTKDNMNKLAKRFYNHSCYLLQIKPYLND